MNDFLAQIPSPQLNGNWAAFYAVMVLVSKDIWKWFADERKERAEIRAQAEKEKLQLKIEEMRQHTLDRIANSNESAVIVLSEVKSELARAHVTARMRHDYLAEQLSGLKFGRIHPSKSAVDENTKVFPQ